MITRDSKLWWLVIAAAVLGFLSTNFELLHQAFPGMTEQHEAWIRLSSMLIGVVAGVLRMSPLPISEQGRSEAIQKNALQAVTANDASIVAAIKAGAAVRATTEAAEAAQVASEEAKAAEVP